MKQSKIKLCIVTGSRAEFGLLSTLLNLIKEDKTLHLQLVVTGMHLAAEFGSTYREIEHQGFKIDENVEMFVDGETPSSIVKSMGYGLSGFATTFERLQPDWIIILGDRYEILAAAIAAHTLRIPIAHLHGGELTEGATDDAYRHAITKMSFLHFTSTEVYKNRVIQLGEHPDRVFNVGAMGIDGIKSVKLLSKNELEKDLDFQFNDSTILVTFHPITLANQTADLQLTPLLNILSVEKDLRILFTMPNADAGGIIMFGLIKEFIVKNKHRAKVVANLGQQRYFSSLQFVKAVVGNSSSGIIEVPYFKVPTVNIGDRQKGRLRPVSVIDSDNNTSAISSALKKAFTPEFNNICQTQQSIYGNGDSAKKILFQLKKVGKLKSTTKRFFDYNNG